jgi:hypothetical protein
VTVALQTRSEIKCVKKVRILPPYVHTLIEQIRVVFKFKSIQVTVEPSSLGITLTNTCYSNPCTFQVLVLSKWTKKYERYKELQRKVDEKLDYDTDEGKEGER